jgi:acetylornithine aminotransferase
MINGIGVHPGHQLPLFFEATWRSLFVDTIMQGNLQQHYRSAYLANQFCKLSHMDHCFLTSSGAMATENALKMMFQKHAPAQRVLAFEHCFIGRTLGLASITDKAIYRDGLPTTLSVDYVPFYNSKDPKSLEKSIHVINGYLHRYPNQYAGMCMELIQGEGGYNVGSSDYFLGLIQFLKENGLCVFVDEI